MVACSTCGIETLKIGRCSPCNKIYMAKYRAENLEKVKAGQRDYYLRNKEVVISKVKKYASENKEKVKLCNARRYDKTKDIRRKQIKKWQAENSERYKELMRIGCLNRIARKRNAEGKYTIKDIRKLYDTQKGLCKVCNASLLDGYHVDHMLPLSRGGDNWSTNLQLLCPTCNMQKGAQTMSEFLERREALNAITRTERDYN